MPDVLVFEGDSPTKENPSQLTYKNSYKALSAGNGKDVPGLIGNRNTYLNFFPKKASILSEK